ncbi:hypothetical protein ILYODFUR_025866 [Ilyodon furcidens]|uniref:Uncharacterized protein n=1 Tax=Ilyodon furcidens TaxID=33524 RepID=A0ABV0VH64_9TELE
MSAPLNSTGRRLDEIQCIGLQQGQIITCSVSKKVTETYLIHSEPLLGEIHLPRLLLLPPLAASNSSISDPRRFQALILTSCSTSNKQT